MAGAITDRVGHIKRGSFTLGEAIERSARVHDQKPVVGCGGDAGGRQSGYDLELALSAGTVDDRVVVEDVDRHDTVLSDLGHIGGRNNFSLRPHPV